ncbi:hypothetical protein [Blastomonas fulva]|uniref:hypothetical protein n=1 Tax=Blastomonas fulva TaxID=1550728 RepID=UPI003D2D3ED7
MANPKRLIAVLLSVAAGGATTAHPNAWAPETPFALPAAGLLVDLDPRYHVRIEPRPDLAGEGFGPDEVAVWGNATPGAALREFSNFRPGGRPLQSAPLPEIAGHRAIVFAEDELVSSDEDALDHLTTGSGYTWMIVVAPDRQTPTRPPFAGVNALFGNLRNGPQFEGFWAGLDDDTAVWAGARNGRSFGRWNADNPKLSGPRLTEGAFVILAGRLEAGRGARRSELFAGSTVPVATATFPVVTAADPSRLAIGQERDATNHPGKESFHGRIARFLLWERPLSDPELAQAMTALGGLYGLDGKAAAAAVAGGG